MKTSRAALDTMEYFLIRKVWHEIGLCGLKRADQGCEIPDQARNMDQEAGPNPSTSSATGSGTGQSCGLSTGINRELEPWSMVANKNVHYCPQAETSGHWLRTESSIMYATEALSLLAFAFEHGRGHENAPKRSPRRAGARLRARKSLKTFPGTGSKISPLAGARSK